MDPSATVLFVRVVVSIHLFFAMAVLQDKAEHKPLWALAYFIAAAFFATLYFRRRLLLRHRHRGGVYHGLGYTAVMLAALASAPFFFSVGAGGMPVPLAIGVWVVLAIAAYFFYRVIVLHLDEMDADEVAVGWRLPV